MTVGEWLRTAAERLRSAGIEAARLEAEVLAAHVLRVERPWLLAHPEAEFPELAGESLLQRRERREPLPYLVGWRDFYGRRFVVRPGVLIPRQETETTVELAIDLARGLGTGATVVDLGTGSGCIGITLKLELPDLQVLCSDLSPRAIEVARQNAELLEADVRLVQADLLSGFAPEAFDLIVSNPPYIDPSEEAMPELAHEPRESLYAGTEGMEIYRRLAECAAAHLKPGGVLVVEVGHTQAQKVRSLFLLEGWSLLEGRSDLLGHERALAFGWQ